MKQPSHHSGTIPWIYGISALLIAGVIAGGAALVTNREVWALLAVGLGALLMGLLLFPIALTMDRSRREASASQQKLIETLEERLQQFSVMLDQISEQQLLSDRAKLVAYRHKDREALRRAIREEIARGDWEAAQILVSDMENAFGYRAEAEQFREDVANKRKESVRRQVSEAMVVIDRHVRVEAWQLASREVERLAELYPDDEMVRRLPSDLAARKEAVKQRLMEQYQEAAQKHDVNRAIDILKKLDLYLTPEEADKIKDSVRSIFDERFNSLINQFKAAVHEHRTDDAKRVGKIVSEEFPNRRASQEIRQWLEGTADSSAVPAGA